MKQAPKRWVVAWTTVIGKNHTTDTKVCQDTWERFNEENGDSYEDARIRYLSLLNEESTYCVSLCEELENEED
ncbi:MAG: hypothetical protein ACPIG6_07795 [Akkermansiaceae bacterium]